MQIENVSLFCFFASYLVALALEGTQFLRASPGMRWAALGFTGAGLVAQTVYLVVRSRQTELPPLLGSSHDWLLVSAWLVIVLYLGVQLWSRDLSWGIFVLPLVVVLVGASRFVSQAPNPRIGTVYWWSLFHASLWVFGILGVFLALIVGLMYLVQHYRLKHKRAEPPALHLLSLERLGQLNWWLIVLSVPLLTLGMITGLWMSYLSMRTEQPVNLMNIAFVANALIWGTMALLFGWLLVSKQATGRGVAWRTVLASGFLLATLLVIKLLSADGIHTGGALGAEGKRGRGEAQWPMTNLQSSMTNESGDDLSLGIEDVSLSLSPLPLCHCSPRPPVPPSPRPLFREAGRNT
jgi:hypothetical protein